MNPSLANLTQHQGLRPSRSGYPLSTFGENARLIMERKGLTHRALAKLAGIGINTVAPIMYRTPRTPTLYAMEWMAEALGEPLWKLLKPLDET